MRHTKKPSRKSGGKRMETEKQSDRRKMRLREIGNWQSVCKREWRERGERETEKKGGGRQ